MYANLNTVAVQIVGPSFAPLFLVALSGKFHFLETHKRTIEWVSASTGKWRTTCLFNVKRLLNRWISSYSIPVALTKRGWRKGYLLGTKKLRTPFRSQFLESCTSRVSLWIDKPNLYNTNVWILDSFNQLAHIYYIPN